MDIIGEIKSGKCTKTNCNLAVVDCVYLNKIKAQTKLMVFTDKELFDYFRNHSEGLIANDIRLILIIPDAHDVSLVESFEQVAKTI
jgi:hypothetical protein